MCVMCHDREISILCRDLFEETKKAVRVLSLSKTVRPVREGFRADSQIDVGEFWGEKWVDIVAKYLGSHHEGITSRDEDLGDLGVLSQVVAEALGFV